MKQSELHSLVFEKTGVGKIGAIGEMLLGEMLGVDDFNKKLIFDYNFNIRFDNKVSFVTNSKLKRVPFIFLKPNKKLYFKEF